MSLSFFHLSTDRDMFTFITACFCQFKHNTWAVKAAVSVVCLIHAQLSDMASIMVPPEDCLWTEPGGAARFFIGVELLPEISVMTSSSSDSRTAAGIQLRWSGRWTLLQAQLSRPPALDGEDSCVAKFNLVLLARSSLYQPSSIIQGVLRNQEQPFSSEGEFKTPAHCHLRV